MRYHKYRYNYNKWVKQTGWDPFKYGNKGKKYYDLLGSDYYENQIWGALNKCWLGFTIAKVKKYYFINFFIFIFELKYNLLYYIIKIMTSKSHL